ncbi:MAG: HD domain-containing protein [Bacilli bacterium]|nr:HD domain-containing protein [Bacilli bacterium]
MINFDELEPIYLSLLNDERIKKMKDISMHNGSNCYIHSFKVAKRSLKKADRCKKELNGKALLYACILHDYYLYDWRKDRSKKKHHGSKHPLIAAEQAQRDFGIDEFTASIIKSHMYPLNHKYKPASKEAKILLWSDNVIATKEFMTSKRRKKRKENQYLEYISKIR